MFSTNVTDRSGWAQRHGVCETPRVDGAAWRFSRVERVCGDCVLGLEGFRRGGRRGCGGAVGGDGFCVRVAATKCFYIYFLYYMLCRVGSKPCADLYCVYNVLHI